MSILDDPLRQDACRPLANTGKCPGCGGAELDRPMPVWVLANADPAPLQYLSKDLFARVAFQPIGSLNRR
jgi:hypothetical protein